MKFTIDVLGVFLKIVVRVNKDTFAPLVVSTLFILLTSILAHCARRLVQGIVKDPFVRLLFEEAIAAAELCGCCFELIIVADNFGVATYAVYLFALTVWWSLNWGEATACPYTHIEDVIEGRGDIRKAVLKTWAELGGGLLVFKYVQMYWALEISDTHKDKAIEDCTADLQVPVLYGALVEGIATCVCRLASRALGDINPRFATAIDAFVGTSLVVAVNIGKVETAVPIDIATVDPGYTYKPIIMFIPDQKPILSRRFENTAKHNKYFRKKRKYKVHDSYYIDDIDLPFFMADTHHRVPSAAHGAEVKFGQLGLIMKKIVHSSFMNSEVMEAIKRWQYDNWWKPRHKWSKV